jgi:hypothetical protein
MSFTLTELLEDVYAELGQLQVSTATGGTPTSLIDTKMCRSGEDDDWKNGTIMILDADGEAPQGEYSPISAYTDSSGTFSLEAALSAAPTQGDTFGLISGYYPVHTMLRLINSGLRTLGDIPLVDTTSLVTVSGKTEYAAKAEWKRRPPYRIDIQTKKAEGDSDWQRVFDWEYVPTIPGESGSITFGKNLADGCALRVWYLAPHPKVTRFDNEIAEVISPSLAVAACVEQALRWQNSRLSGGDTFMLQRWNDAKRTLEQARLLYPIWRPKRTAQMKMTGIGASP